jgi:hypothetical protein
LRIRRYVAVAASFVQVNMIEPVLAACPSQNPIF